MLVGGIPCGLEQALRDLRVAQVVKLDMKVENGKVAAFLLCGARLRDPRRDHALRDRLRRQRARADAARAAGALHRQRHPDHRELRPGRGAGRPRGRRQGRRRGGGLPAPGRARPALRAAGGAAARVAPGWPATPAGRSRDARPRRRSRRIPPAALGGAAVSGAGAVPDGGGRRRRGRGGVRRPPLRRRDRGRDPGRRRTWRCSGRCCTAPLPSRRASTG
jgi:hypothetical protein